MNLVVGDLFKTSPILAAVMGNAVSIIKWFNNHSLALGLLRKCQSHFGAILALLMPAKMRWTSHYRSASRLLESEKAVKTCVINHRDELISGAGPKEEHRRKAANIITIIGNEQFWAHLRM
ncbi:hypothetical protein BDV93DRAFT_460103 [Ceratobasidium sp. AG-I]|nr:hypothetical protein BDV93DRAFT_460371 [Ceratobasidium sp. AG-I]KAF8593871.1 hypothetical protein BDV93DRAFT_460103 [Ceratobasidium sp. AG-I]